MEPIRLLGDGRVVMSSAYNGRVAAAQAEQPQLALSWNGGIYDFDYWALPRGISKAEQARRFVAFASQPEAQRSFAEKIAYGPVNRQAIAALDPKVSANLPTAPANLAGGGVGMDAAFWPPTAPPWRSASRPLGRTLIPASGVVGRSLQRLRPPYSNLSYRPICAGCRVSGLTARQQEQRCVMAENASSDVLVSFQGVQKSCDGESLIVKDLNLGHPQGRVFTLLGPSGSARPPA